ncbi:MAG: hypothetical protein Q9226_005549 [Calogaya cf. arnoldii]
MHNASSDDALTGVSLILLVIAAAFLSAAVHHGLGRHPYYLEAKEIQKATEMAIYFEPPCIMAFSLPKLAVAQVLIQISPPNKRRALFLIEAAVIISAVSVPQLRPFVLYVRSVLKEKTKTVGKKHTTVAADQHDNQDLLQAGQSHGSQQDYTVSVWNTTPPSEEDPAFIKLPDRILRATDLRLEYEDNGLNRPQQSNQTLT